MGTVNFRSVAAAYRAKLLKTPVPLQVVFEVTHLCNLACDYCDRHTPKPNELTLAQITKLIEEFAAMGMQGMTLDGGDPLARKDISKIVDKLHELGIKISINTNAILVPKHIESVKKATQITVSLDGPAPYHDSIRGKDAFSRAIRGIKRARAEGVLVKLRCTLHKDNMGSVPELVQIAQELDAPIVFQPAMNSLFLDTQRDGTAWAPPTEQFINTIKWLAAEKAKNPYIGNHYASLKHFLFFPEDKEPPCAAGWVEVTMDPEGNLFHCGKMNRQSQYVNAAQLGAKKAFETIARYSCSQCWCASQVEANYAWGLQFQKFLRFGMPTPDPSEMPHVVVTPD